MPKAMKSGNKQQMQNISVKKDIWNNRRKKGRLIVRNLSFKITEEQLRQHFIHYGEIRDMCLLRRSDGKLVGCGFVEYANKEDAKKAIAATSGKPLLNRPIIVDWAVPKDLFHQNKNNIKQEDIEMKEETLSSSDEEETYLPAKSSPEKRVKTKIKLEDSDSSKHETNDDEEGDSSGADSNQSSDLDDDAPIGKSKKYKEQPLQCDVNEGCTVFLKNVPFTATNEDLKQCMLKFGPIIYALICIDPLTEHSKGTAFVKFQKRESADKCIKASANQLKLGTSVLEPHIALEKQQLHNQITEKKSINKSKDGRNLYLIKEGIVQAGSIAAKGVSTADMGKRLQLEQWKTQMLRNLSMVVSGNRLAVHNLPPTLDDEGLRKIFKKHSPAGSKITEARIMRDLRQVDAQRKGISKEFGFVTFTQHSDALAALRAINNNPSIFATQKRPIVGFSIENKAILNAKQRRLEMSRHKNPYFQNGPRGSSREKNSVYTNSAQINKLTTYQHDEPIYAGIEAHSGQSVKLPSTQTLKSQARTHRVNVQHERKKVKLQQKIKNEKNRKIKRKQELKMEKSKNTRCSDEKEDQAFDKLVKKYKQQIERTVDLKKWYE